MTSIYNLAIQSKLPQKHGKHNYSFLRQLDLLASKKAHQSFTVNNIEWFCTKDVDAYFKDKGEKNNTNIVNYYIQYNDKEYKVLVKYHKKHQQFELGIFTPSQMHTYNNQADKYYKIGAVDFEEQQTISPFSSRANGYKGIREQAIQHINTTFMSDYFQIDDNELNENLFCVLLEYAAALNKLRGTHSKK